MSDTQNYLTPEEIKSRKAAVDETHRERQRELNDLRVVLSAREGRRLVWRLLGHCRVYGSVMHQDPYIHAYNSGQQDVGHFLMSEIIEANPEAYLVMTKEAQKEAIAKEGKHDK